MKLNDLEFHHITVDDVKYIIINCGSHSVRLLDCNWEVWDRKININKC